MSAHLRGKKILFFGPVTFNYEKAIVDELERQGAQVVYRSDKPGHSFLIKVLVRLFPKMLWGYSDRVFGRWFAKNGPAECDIVFVIKGEGLSPRFLDVLKGQYKNAKFIFYLWDSIKNVRNAELLIPKFDYLYSFDPEDCRQYPLFKYRPLFFLEQYRVSAPTEGKGCFFIGTLNGDRPAVISHVLDALPKTIAFDYSLFVRNDIELFFRRLFDNALKHLDPVRLIRTPMTAQIVSQRFQTSAAIVDIEHPNQVGLTMRTFEVLASGKKLITTNKNIATHDFYHPSRICIIDRIDPKLETDFFEGQMEPLPMSFFVNFSLNGWLLEIFQCVTTNTDKLSQ